MRLLVTGSTGQVGREVVAEAIARGWEVTALARTAARPCDLTDREAVLALVTVARPDLVIHAAARTDVDGCERDPVGAHRVNVAGSRHVAEAAATVGAHVVGLSTDYVYDGATDRDYVETDATNPLSVYGRTKLAGEAALGPTATIVRASWVCGDHGANMVRTVVRLATGDGPLRFVDDQVGQPTIVADLVPHLLRLAEDRAAGVFHVTNVGAMSWYGFARTVVAAAGGDPGRVEPIATADLDPPRPAARPPRAVLDGAALRHAGYPAMPPSGPALETLVHRLLAA